MRKYCSLCENLAVDYCCLQLFATYPLSQVVSDFQILEDAHAPEFPSLGLVSSVLASGRASEPPPCSIPGAQLWGVTVAALQPQLTTRLHFPASRAIRDYNSQHPLLLGTTLCLVLLGTAVP